MMIFILLCFSVCICIDSSFEFEYFEKYPDHYHETELIKRVENDEKVKDYLTSWLYKYQANRIFIIQYHNGTKDWQHGTMRFEKCSANTVSMKSDYVNFNLTWLDMPFYLKEHDYFIGNVCELKNIDPILYEQLNNYNINNVAFIIIKGNDEIPIGILGFTGNNLNINGISLLNESKIIYEYIK